MPNARHPSSFSSLLLMKPIKALFDQPQYLGFCFLFTAFFLYVGIRLGSIQSEIKLEKRKWKNSLIIGISQAVAILPGISRSGATISTARILGFSAQEAVTFSFLLAIPTVLGGIVLELLQLFKHTEDIASLSFAQYFSGFLTSFAVGYFALKLLMKLAIENKFIYFVWYCLFIGIATLIYFH